MAEFFVQAQKRGFAVELLGSRNAYINGKLCIQRKACWHDVGRGEYKYTYLLVFVSLEAGLISARGNYRMAAF